ncbi:MAG: nucleotidyl transferase AbiEii/AbiGii toxin family protein [Bdellovibrionia bacterium]
MKNHEEKTFPHLDRDSFKEALRFAEGKTGFSSRLIEKDYFCSVVLRELSEKEKHLIFKGGTLLNKVHAGFYRLSEDLDFTISTDPDLNRAGRSKNAAPMKEWVANLSKKVPGLLVERQLTGSNQSVQYNATLAYESTLLGTKETILLEIGQRERVHEPEKGYVGILARDPYSDVPLVGAFSVMCLSKREAYSEKVRAALTRKNAAIRDLYDLDHAFRNKLISLDEAWWWKKKLQVPGTGEIQISDSRKKEFKSQLETDLKPVLRDQDFNAFDFDGAWRQLELVAKAVQQSDKVLRK